MFEKIVDVKFNNEFSLHIKKFKKLKDLQI